jgi:prenyltransferase beta subunit
LQTKQLPNGGLECWTPGEADNFTTIKTVIALGAARRPVSFLTSVSDTTPLDYLATRAVTYTHDITGTLFPGRAGMLAVAVVAGDDDPYNFGGMDVINELVATYHPATGAYSTTAQQGWSSGAAGTINQLWAILGLAAAQETVSVSATDFLIGLQETDGGWGYGFGGDVDTTALVLQALIGSGNAGPTHAKVQEGLAFLRNTQAASGGWESWGSLSADSTAAVIQALVAAGYTPATESWAAASGRTPHDDLVDLQAADGGFGGNALSTAHAIAGLTETGLPVFGREQRAQRALAWLDEMNLEQHLEAVMAFGAAGYDVSTVMSGTIDLWSWTEAQTTTISNTARTADDGQLLMAVVAISGTPTDFGGANLVSQTWSHYGAATGAFGASPYLTDTWAQAWPILGLAAAGEPIPVTATNYLTSLQNSDGGWPFSTAWGGPSDSNSTALAMQALLAAEVPTDATFIVSATDYLENLQNSDGGWPYNTAWGPAASDANSTAYVVQALLALDQDLTVSKWATGGIDPLHALYDFQKSDGPFVWQWDSPWTPPSDDAIATRQAVLPLMGMPFPLARAVSYTAFTPINRGPDPDRLVACPPRAAWGNSVDVTIPFGSDLDTDGSVTLDWRVSGETLWVTGTTVHRADGYYTATLPVTDMVSYEFQATFTDPDKVQYGTDITVSAIGDEELLNVPVNPVPAWSLATPEPLSSWRQREAQDRQRLPGTGHIAGTGRRRRWPAGCARPVAQSCWPGRALWRRLLHHPLRRVQRTADQRLRRADAFRPERRRRLLFRRGHGYLCHRRHGLSGRGMFDL